MRIFCLSDLHLEFYKPGKQVIRELWQTVWQPKMPPKIDTLILAGDIGYPYPLGSPLAEQYQEFLALCKANYTNVLLVPGNHEYYAARPLFAREPVLAALKEICAATHVTLLHQTAISIAGIRFLGTTLWSAVDNPAFKAMNDSRYVFANQLDYLEAFVSDYQWLRRELASKTAEPTVVITHHLPTPKLIHPVYGTSPLNSGFATDILNALDPQLLQPIKLWFCGHSHERMVVHYNNHLVLSLNPIGYPAEQAKRQTETDFETVFEV